MNEPNHLQALAAIIDPAEHNITKQPPNNTTLFLNGKVETFSLSDYEDDDDDSGFCCPCCLPR